MTRNPYQGYPYRGATNRNPYRGVTTHNPYRLPVLSATKPGKIKTRAGQSDLEATFVLWLALWLPTVDLPAPVPEHRFHPSRLWRFDFAWPDQKVAVEIDGLVYDNKGNRGGHQTVGGILADAEKYEAAQVLGWTVYRVPGPWVEEARPQVMDTLAVLLNRPNQQGAP